MASVVVEPQVTEVTVPTKTPEEIQQEAEDSGWLTMWHEFTWWPPWYRLHVKIEISGATIDIGFNPMLPFGEFREIVVPSGFLPPIPITIDPELARQIIMETIIGTAVEVFGFAAIAVAAANTHITPISLIGLGIYGGGLGFLLGYAWSLYISGNRLEALSTLASLGINAIGAGLGGLLHCAFQEATSIFVNAIAAPILGVILSNLINPQGLIISISATLAILITALVIELILLHLVPDPINAWFYPAFIFSSFAFAITAFHLYDQWAR